MPDFLPVLLGSDANAYGMARSFYEAYGVTSAVICKRALPATAHSLLARVAVVEPKLEEDAVFLRTLTDFARGQTRPLVLVSCADGYTLLMARHRAVLRQLYHFACPEYATVQNLANKAGFYAACAQHGLACPASVLCTAADYRTAPLPFDFPVIVKPANSAAYWNCSFAHKKKVFLARDRVELDLIAAAIYASTYRDGLILQQYIPGDDSQMRVINAYCGPGGEIRLMAVGRPLLEERTPEGIGNYAAILTGPEYNDSALLQPLAAFLRAVGWRGFANFDIKQDPRTGQYFVLELNPRQGRASYYVTAAGHNLARVLVRDVLVHCPAHCAVLQARRLWLLTPFGIVRRYAPNRKLVAQAAYLRRLGKSRNQLLCWPDVFPARLGWYLLHQLRYGRKMKRYNGKNGFIE